MAEPVIIGPVMIVVIVVVLYLYLWMHNPRAAMDVTTAIFRVLWYILIGIFKVLSAIIAWIGRMIVKKRR